jgi:hypothetical protein
MSGSSPMSTLLQNMCENPWTSANLPESHGFLKKITLILESNIVHYFEKAIWEFLKLNTYLMTQAFYC